MGIRRDTIDVEVTQVFPRGFIRLVGTQVFPTFLRRLFDHINWESFNQKTKL